MRIDLLILVAVVVVAAFLLAGCDSAEYDRLQAAAEYKDRFFNGCLPRKGDTVTAQWVNGELICRRITPSPRYGTTFPHAEVRIATIEEL